MKHLFVFIFFIILGFNVKAQPYITDTLQIKSVNVVSNRLQNFVSGNRVEHIGSLDKIVFRNDMLATILENTTSIAIRTYGASGIASASIRGTNSNHIAVLWNGFSIQDPLTSGLGLSLIPSGFIDNVSVQYGGSSSLFGSAAIGGVIHLNNKASFNKGFNIGVNSAYGSFNKYDAGLNLSFSNKKLNSSLKTFYKTAQNDFPFLNTEKFGKPKETNKNSAIESFALLQENFVRFSDYSLLSTHYWFQQTFSQVPYNMILSAGTAHQEDKGHKAAVKFYKNINKIDLYFKSGFFLKSVHYINNEVDIDVVHASQRWINELETKVNISKSNSVNLGLNNSFTKGKSENFSGTKKLNNLAFYLSYKYKTGGNKIVVVSSFRQEYFNNKFIEPNLSIGSDFIFSKKIKGKVSISKNFRTPTFNDLYWLDGFAKGNPDLLPEKAYATDLGFAYFPFKEKQLLGIEINLFGNYIKNLILWQPFGSSWMPVNLKENLARGIELNISSVVNVGTLQINSKLAYSYTKSTVEKIADNETENILHNQLPYIPYHKLNTKVAAKYKSLSVSYFQNYVGKRYTGAANLKEIKAYLIGNLDIRYNLSFKKINTSAYLKINNIWDVSYQMVYLYPNPLRNYELGVSLDFRVKGDANLVGLSLLNCL